MFIRSEIFLFFFLIYIKIILEIFNFLFVLNCFNVDSRINKMILEGFDVH